MQNTKKLCDLFLSLKEREDFTMILVTHNPQVAIIGNRILEMRDGAIRGEISKSVLENVSYLPSKQELPSEKVKTKFPPNFCQMCGNNVIITPKQSMKSGMWVEKDGDKTEFELKFAQCANCGELYWQPAKIGIRN